MDGVQELPPQFAEIIVILLCLLERIDLCEVTTLLVCAANVQTM